MKYCVRLMWLTAVVTLLFGGVFNSSAASDELRSDWDVQQRAAQTPEQRVALAHELLVAAREADDKDMTVDLAMRAFHIGSRQLASYHTAADALDLVQRTAPERRIDCLDKLRYLYDTAYQQQSNKLRLGTGLADVLGELSEQRYESLHADFAAGLISPAQAIERMQLSLAEMNHSHQILSRVIERATNDSERAERMGRLPIAKALDDFANEFRPIHARTVERANALRQEHQWWQRLVAASRRFEADDSRANAETLAALYVIDLDRPELISRSVLNVLDEPMRRPIQLATRRPDTLDQYQAMQLATWYRDLVEQATSDDRAVPLLIRARLYAVRAREAGHADAISLQNTLEAALGAAGVDAKIAAHHVNALAMRLNEQLVADVTQQSAPAEDPASADSEPEPAPIAVADSTASAQSTQHKAEAPHTTMVAGRPMTTCDQCGRQFFAGWGVEASTCQRCQSGQRNIFDFGRE